MIDIKVSNGLILNILIHVLILFSFLYVFFFAFISEKEETIMNLQITNITKDNIPHVLKSIDDYDTHKKINWKELKTKCEQIISSSESENISGDIKNKNNNNLKIVGGITIAVMILIIFCVYLYFNYYLSPGSIDLKMITIENIVVFFFIGIVEFIFFTNTASNYIPVYPNVIGQTILDTLKDKLQEI
jgi:hypothetical protein